MNAQTRKIMVAGPAGAIEVALDYPAAGTTPRGLALVAHPHPLFGGTMDNKVVQTLARVFVQLGYVAARANFRGVGQTEGVHDHGVGEADDLRAVLAHLQAEAPFAEVVLGGFSFGSYVQTQVATRLAEQGQPAARLVLVGTAASRWKVALVPADTLVIHGELDETVPLQAVLDWARPQDLPVVVIPGADHFFHRRLTLIKQLVLNAWLGSAALKNSAETTNEDH
jgi:alpha/beta superfamily hydrolase